MQLGNYRIQRDPKCGINACRGPGDCENAFLFAEQASNRVAGHVKHFGDFLGCDICDAPRPLPAGFSNVPNLTLGGIAKASLL